MKNWGSSSYPRGRKVYPADTNKHQGLTVTYRESYHIDSEQSKEVNNLSKERDLKTKAREIKTLFEGYFHQYGV